MSTNITTAFVNEYKSGLERLVRQEGSVLMNTVTVENITGEQKFFDQIDGTVAKQVTSAFQDTQYSEGKHYRRRLIATPWQDAILLDKFQQKRLLNDPRGEYAKALSDSLGVAMDVNIVSALGGTAYGGKDGSTSITLPTSQKVAVNLTGANTNLAVEKLYRARTILRQNNVRNEQLFCICDPLQLESLLKQLEPTSEDYNNVKALVSGDITQWLGLNFIYYNDLPKSGNNRSVYVYAKSAIKLGLQQGIETKMEYLPTKNYSLQIYASADFGATRMQEKKVVEITCDESAAE